MKWIVLMAALFSVAAAPTTQPNPVEVVKETITREVEKRLGIEEKKEAMIEARRSGKTQEKMAASAVYNKAREEEKTELSKAFSSDPRIAVAQKEQDAATAEQDRAIAQAKMEKAAAKKAKGSSMDIGEFNTFSASLISNLNAHGRGREWDEVFSNKATDIIKTNSVVSPVVAVVVIEWRESMNLPDVRYRVTRDLKITFIRVDGDWQMVHADAEVTDVFNDTLSDPAKKGDKTRCDHMASLAESIKTANEN